MVRRCFPVAKIAGSSPVWVVSTLGIILLKFFGVFRPIFSLPFLEQYAVFSGVSGSEARLGVATWTSRETILTIRYAAAGPVFLVSNILQKCSKSEGRDPELDDMICCSCSLKYVQANTGAVAAWRIPVRTSHMHSAGDIHVGGTNGHTTKKLTMQIPCFQTLTDAFFNF